MSEASESLLNSFLESLWLETQFRLLSRVCCRNEMEIYHVTGTVSVESSGNRYLDGIIARPSFLANWWVFFTNLESFSENILREKKTWSQQDVSVTLFPRYFVNSRRKCSRSVSARRFFRNLTKILTSSLERFGETLLMSRHRSIVYSIENIFSRASFPQIEAFTFFIEVMYRNAIKNKGTRFVRPA